MEALVFVSSHRYLGKKLPLLSCSLALGRLVAVRGTWLSPPRFLDSFKVERANKQEQAIAIPDIIGFNERNYVERGWHIT